MTRNTEIAGGVCYGILMGAVTVTAASLPAQAQQAADQEETTLTTVVVTGSRIPQPNLEEVSPVTAISSDEIKMTGATTCRRLWPHRAATWQTARAARHRSTCEAWARSAPWCWSTAAA